jgi:hypothetical protein
MIHCTQDVRCDLKLRVPDGYECLLLGSRVAAAGFRVQGFLYTFKYERDCTEYDNTVDNGYTRGIAHNFIAYRFTSPFTTSSFCTSTR